MRAARTPVTVSARTLPRFWSGSSTTVAVSPNPSSVPGSVRVTSAGTATVLPLVGLAGADSEVDADGVLASSASLPQPTSSRLSATGAMRAARREGRRAISAADQSLGEVGADLVEAHPLLLHRVPLADGDRVVLEGVEVDGDAVRRTDLVLAPVAPTDRTGVVEVDVPQAAQLRGEALGLRGEVGVARGREHGDLHRRQSRVEPQHRALVDPALGVGRLVLGVGVDEEGHQGTAQTGCRLDDVGDVALTGGLVEVRQVLTGGLGVGREVEVGAVGDALELTPLRAAEAEAVLDVDGPLGVVGELLLRVLVVPQVVAGE